MYKERLKKMSRKGLLYFLAAMLLFSVLSRCLDSLTVAKVSVGYVNKGPVVYDMSGTGSISAKENFYVNMEAGLRLKSLDCGIGDMVEEGRLLFAYMTEDVEALYKKLEREYEKLELTLLQEQLGQTPLPSMTEEELAGQRLAVAERDCSRGVDKLNRAQQEYETELEKLNREFARKLEQTEEELSESARLDYLSAKNTYRQTEAEMEAAMEALEEEVRQTGEEYDELVNAGAPQDEISKAESAMESAMRARDKAAAEWNRELNYVEVSMDLKEEAYDRIKFGGSGLDAVEKEYEASKKALDAGLASAGEALQALTDARDEAVLGLENARKNDSYKKVSEARQWELSKLRERSMEIDMEEKKEELDTCSRLLEQQGQVFSPVSGTVLAVTGEPGSATTGQEQIRLGTGTPVMEVLMDQEQAELLSANQSFSVKLQGSQAQLYGTLTGMTQAPDDQMKLLVELEDGKIGKNADYTCSVASGNYNQTIPIEALREDNKGFYCLAVGEQNTFLGTEMVAVRMNLEVLEKSQKMAAVQGAIDYDDKLIVSGNKTVKENDRVRVVD